MHGVEDSPDKVDVLPEGDTLVQEEEKDTGIVKLHVYKSYWVAVGHCLATMVLLFIFLMQGSHFCQYTGDF